MNALNGVWSPVNHISRRIKIRDTHKIKKKQKNKKKKKVYAL